MSESVPPETQPSQRRRHKRRPKNSLEANKKDSLGFYPIHWAALKNKCDLIGRILDEDPQSLSRQCSNKLFADGTPLHLAAMSGSLEAACLILTRSQRGDGESENELTKLLEALDSDGQTPLMRSAAPQTRRWNTIRELLQKNFWSLSGRAAEMALFLIAVGADWRKTEPINGMNLLHLAIINNYDDIVSLLLVLDRKLISVATLKPNDREKTRPKTITPEQIDGANSEIDLASDGPVSPSSRPLIDSSRENAENLIAKGIRPLELAVLYGRVKIIGLLWRPRKQVGDTATNETDQEEDSITNANNNQAELKQLLVRACFSDSDELARFLKPLVLKALLAIDLVVIALVWAPAYCLSVVTNDDNHHDQHATLLRPSLKGGIFFVSYCASLALTLRVMLKNPGFLRRHSVHYLSELAKLLNGVPKAHESIALRLGKKTKDHNKEKAPVELEQKQTPPLLKLDDTTSILVENGTKPKVVDQVEEDKSNKTTTLAFKPEQSGRFGPAEEQRAGDRIGEIQFGVRYLCHRCQCIRRARSRHCNYCDHCVQDFDHHCIYLGCCIGRNNRLDFLLAMIALAVTSIYGTILHLVGVNQRHHSGGGSSIWHLIAFIWMFKYAIIGGVTAFCQLRRACMGVTLYEEVRSKRLRSKFGRRGPPKEISRTYATLSTLDEDQSPFWRYLPYDSPPQTTAGGQQQHLRRGWLKNLREFANYISPDEYLLTLICTDTPLARSLLTRSSDLRIKQQQQQQQQLHKLA